MSYNEKEGTLISIGNTATYSYFSGLTTVDAVLLQEDGTEIEVKIPSGNHFYPVNSMWSPEDKIAPAIGDFITAGWDYGSFLGVIRKFAEDRRELVFPTATESNAFDAATIRESLVLDDDSWDAKVLDQLNSILNEGDEDQ